MNNNLRPLTTSLSAVGDLSRHTVRYFFSNKQSWRTASTSPVRIVRTGNCLVKSTIPIGGDGIGVNQYAEAHRLFTSKEVHLFSQLISDPNPIHQSLNEESDQLSQGKSQIVHGMLTASIFSSIFGTLIPGSIYRSQNILFHSPIYSNEEVIGRVNVKEVKDMKGRGMIVICDTIIEKKSDNKKTKDYDEMTLCVSGKASVWLPVS